MDAGCSRAVTCHGDVIGVTAKARDIVSHPGQRHDQIEQRSVRGRIGAVDPAETVEAKAIRHADRHDAVAVEGVPVVPGGRGRPCDVSTAVDPHHDGCARIGAAGMRRKNVDQKRVIAGD